MFPRQIKLFHVDTLNTYYLLSIVLSIRETLMRKLNRTLSSYELPSLLIFKKAFQFLLPQKAISSFKTVLAITVVSGTMFYLNQFIWIILVFMLIKDRVPGKMQRVTTTLQSHSFQSPWLQNIFQALLKWSKLVVALYLLLNNHQSICTGKSEN